MSTRGVVLLYGVAWGWCLLVATVGYLLRSC